MIHDRGEPNRTGTCMTPILSVQKSIHFLFLSYWEFIFHLMVGYTLFIQFFFIFLPPSNEWERVMLIFGPETIYVHDMIKERCYFEEGARMISTSNNRIINILIEQTQLTNVSTIINLPNLSMIGEYLSK